MKMANMFFNKVAIIGFVTLFSVSSYGKNLKLIESFDQAIVEPDLIGNVYRFKITACKNVTAKFKRKGVTFPSGLHLMNCFFYSGGVNGTFYFGTKDSEWAGYLSIATKVNGAELKCKPVSILNEGKSSDNVMCDPYFVEK